MKSIKNVLICGIGAIGSIYAYKINKIFPENLKILVDKKRLENYKKNPKIFNNEKLNLNYILPEETTYKADLIIIATKYNALQEVVENIENFIKKDTIIISLLNGVTSEEEIASKYGWKHVLLSYFIGHSAMRNGNIITYDGIGSIVFGAKDNGITDKNDVEVLKNYFDSVKINYQIPEDIWRSLWLKYMLNVSSNQLSAILHTTFGQMQSNHKFMELMKNVMKEVQIIAQYEGVNNTETMVNEAVENFKKMSPEGKTSMLQDVEAKRKTEVEMFAGHIISLGQKYNIQTPYNCFLKEMIEIIHGL
ncbi:ketopantoate reductase family protein [bacterium]|nr:ketopantoate reductase family protein [bacterium]